MTLDCITRFLTNYIYQENYYSRITDGKRDDAMIIILVYTVFISRNGSKVAFFGNYSISVLSGSPCTVVFHDFFLEIWLGKHPNYSVSYDRILGNNHTVTFYVLTAKINSVISHLPFQHLLRILTELKFFQ